ncbi:histone deacetylase [Nocardioides sp. HM23]|uniref:histone deacetylase n=1 Tax=Nocardioides bizhenqiangii TaxID=3095076 RepID=UPI002ACABAEB|nr:histone deacetylase [Nocardioides sp. HM23]MDZ5623424.1 histone deacetylase [Nocardioides sp. HM23]
MTPTRPVWYAAYGSNTDAARFGCYLRGGCPDGGTRTHPGCRDTTPPAATKPLWLPGSVYFAGMSTVWGGGMAFYDPATPGPVAARGWLVTVQQLADLITQEMHDDPGNRPDLEHRIRTIVSRSGDGIHSLGSGRYETLVTTRSLDGTPVVTFTARRAHHRRERRAPSPRYQATIAAGLAQVGHGHASPQPVL